MSVVLAEDHALLRDGLIRLLGAHGFDVVEAVDNGPSLLRALINHRPDVAVVDVRLPPPSPTKAFAPPSRPAPGFRSSRCSCCPKHVEQLCARELLSDGGGGVGYLLKDRVVNIAQFLDAVHRVAAGGTAMDPEVIATLLANNTADAPVQTLTGRERDVLALMAEGRTNAAIAAVLVITEKAVGKHTNNIFAKLGLRATGDDNVRVLAVLTYLHGDRPRARE